MKLDKVTFVRQEMVSEERKAVMEPRKKRERTVAERTGGNHGEDVGRASLGVI